MSLGDHVLTTETLVQRPREEVYAFFSDAGNLQRITPPELDFAIRTPLPIRMGQGTLIEYELRLFRIPFPWTTLISLWEPGDRFVDEQVKGPYARWVHTHTFADAPGGTRVTDRVDYRLPLFPAGEVAYPLVRRQLRRIFEYRRERLREILGTEAREE